MNNDKIEAGLIDSNLHLIKDFNLYIIFVIILYGAYLSFFPQLLASRFQANSVVIGMTMSFMSLTTAFCSSQLGRVSNKISLQNLLYLSSLFYSLSLLVLASVSSWTILIFGVLLFGMAHGFFIPNIQTALVGFAPLSERAAFMSLNSVVLRIGQTLGPIVTSFFYINKNLRPVFWVTAIFGILMIVIIKIMVGAVEN